VSGDERRLYGGEFDEYLHTELEDYIELLVDRLDADGEPYDGTDFVEWSVHHPSHQFLPPTETPSSSSWVQLGCENGQTAEDWELGGGESDTKAAEAFLAKLADGVTYMMANEVVARHRIELRGASRSLTANRTVSHPTSTASSSTSRRSPHDRDHSRHAGGARCDEGLTDSARGHPEAA
jgi:hypothetical protein